MDSTVPSPRQDSRATSATPTDTTHGNAHARAPMADPLCIVSGTPPGMLRKCLSLNAVQRVLSAGVLVPLVTMFIWQSPAFATVTVCSLIQSLCAYEFAWLAHRIQNRLVRALQATDLSGGDGSTTTTTTPATASPDGTPLHHGSDEEIHQHDPSPSTSTTTSPNSSDTTHDVRVTGTDTEEARDAAEAFTEQLLQSATTTTTTAAPPRLVSADSLLINDDHDNTTSQCAITPLATWLAQRSWLATSSPSYAHEWLVTVAVSALLGSLTSLLFLFVIVPWIPGLEQTELYASRVFFSLATDFVGALCACRGPNWQYALVILLENLAFTVLTMHSTVCPINQFSCSLTLEPAHVLLVSIGLLLLFRMATTSTTSGAAFVLFTLDTLGFVYIVGTLSIMVAFVDDDKRTLYRKLLIVLLYVTWASDTGAYVTGKLLAAVKYPFYHPLAAHLSKNKDYEGTLGAIVWGVAAMFLASYWLDVGGSPASKTAFSVVAVVIGRFGDLFESLLKRAAGVKDSGSLIPGHGGVLDRIDALMFVTLVFARYYAMVLRAE